MEDEECLVPIPEIQKAVGGRSRAFVYASVLPHLELVKVGSTTNATRKSLREYLAGLPRVSIGSKKAAA